MHDELLERRLRDTLREEADGQAFTITAAELERRVALRGRNAGGRRLTLLLAAAVAIGVLGVGSLVGGFFDDRNLAPQPSPMAETTDPPPTPTPDAGPVVLPDLDALIAANLSGDVVFAQSNGAAEGPEPISGIVSLRFPPPFVRVDLQEPNGIYAITLACLGGTAGFTLLPDAADPALEVPCDGRTRNEAVDVEGARVLQLSYSEAASWRIVVRRAPSTGPTTPPDPAALLTAPGQEALLSLVNETTESGVLSPTVPSMPGLTQQAGAIPGRLSYLAQASCVGEGPIRFALGDDTGGTIATTTTTQIPCDGLARSIELGLPQPFGSQVFVGAATLTRWSLLITSDMPPVSLADGIPGWTVVAGLGPDLEFGATIRSFSGLAVDDGGPMQVVLDCAGQGTIEVTVDLQASSGSGTFVASCSPEGNRNSQTFDAPSYARVHVSFQASAGQWTALSLLVPDEATEQP